MYLLDIDTTPGTKTSRMITRGEHKELYPAIEHSRALSYIFRHKIPVDVPEDQAKVLLKKYPTLQMTNDCGEITINNTELKAKLDDLDWHALKKYAVEQCGMPYKETNIKRADLTDKILESVS